MASAQDRQDGSVGRGVDELVGVPTRGQRAGLGLAVADDAGDDQVGGVKGGAEGVELAVAVAVAGADGEVEMLGATVGPFAAAALLGGARRRWSCWGQSPVMRF